MTTYDILLCLLGYVMTVFGMYVNDFRRTFMDDDKQIHYQKIILESAVIYLFYFLIAKDVILDVVSTFFGFTAIYITEKVSLGINLMMGIVGYDKLYKFVVNYIKYRQAKAERSKKGPTETKDDDNKAG